MELLKQRILQDGKVKTEDILKVDSFLNHQMDVSLFEEIGKEFKRLFEGKPVDKIVTVEASGIGIACITGLFFNVPVVFAKKTQSSNISKDVYVSEVYSYTHCCTNRVLISKEFLKPGENILLIDDFLAEGNAMTGLIEILDMAGCKLTGVGIAIEKGFQDGGKKLRERGIHLESLAIVERLDPRTGAIVFRNDKQS